MIGEEEFVDRHCEWCEDEECNFENDFPKLEECMAKHKGEKMEYCISGFYSEVIKAESKEEAIEILMGMELRNITKVDIDYINDETYIYDNM